MGYVYFCLKYQIKLNCMNIKFLKCYSLNVLKSSISWKYKNATMRRLRIYNIAFIVFQNFNSSNIILYEDVGIICRDLLEASPSSLKIT